MVTKLKITFHFNEETDINYLEVTHDCDVDELLKKVNEVDRILGDVDDIENSIYYASGHNINTLVEELLKQSIISDHKMLLSITVTDERLVKSEPHWDYELRLW